jgi:glycosyltransferase involved in cell wall biosynthesis
MRGDGRIRIARVIARLNVGGPAIHVAALTARLPADRFESRLFAGEVCPGEVEMTEVLDREGVTPVKIQGLGRAIHAYHDALALAGLVQHFRTLRPHVVHTHTAKAGALGRMAALLCGARVVVHTFHGHVFEGYFSPWANRAVVGIERQLARASSAIVTISPRQHADITRRFRVAPEAKTHVIPLGFDLSRFEHVSAHRGRLRHALGIGEAALLASVGRLTAVKDHALLLRAVAAIGDDNVHLCLVGGGELERPLRALAAELGLRSRVHFIGFRTDLEAVLADVDVVALTSRNEGTPVALIEALAAGCSIVAVDVGGVPDVLEEGKWGRIAPSRDPADIASALRQALAYHRTRPADAVAAGRSYALRRYSIDRLVADHVTLYETLLARAGRT